MDEEIPKIPAQEASSGAVAFAWRHRVALGRGTLLALIAVVILQNLEPTSLDLLFWSLPSVPKLVVIIGAMALGAGLWEVLRRLLFPSRP